MARPLRIERVGGRYHATARGNERRNIFRDDPDRFHFLELLSDMPERFGVRLHACVLMDNHFHLLIETPEANLSRSRIVGMPGMGRHWRGCVPSR